MIARRTMLLAAMAVPPVRAAAVAAAARPADRLAMPWWRARHEAVLRRLATGEPVDLVLLGDSITQDWEHSEFAPVWQRFYGGRRALNLGFKGDTTAHLLWRIENGELAGIAPRAAVLLIGANNFGHLHASVADTVDGVTAVLDAVRRRLPKTPVLLVGVLPSIRSAWVDERTAETNAALARRYGGGADPRVAWLDLTPLFLDSAGRVDRTKFLDIDLVPPEPPLHPNVATQARMAAAMEPTLARWLGDAPRA